MNMCHVETSEKGSGISPLCWDGMANAPCPLRVLLLIWNTQMTSQLPNHKGVDY